MEIKEIIESGFFKTLLSNYVDYYVSYHYNDHDRLIYALCSSLEEKNIATREEIRVIKKKIRELGHEIMSFEFLMRYKSKNPHAHSEQENDSSYWESQFYEHFIYEISEVKSLTPFTDAKSKIDKLPEVPNPKDMDEDTLDALFWINDQTRNVPFMVECEEEIMDQIEADIYNYTENEDWDIDLFFYEGYIEQSDTLKLLYNLCDLLTQLFRLRTFEEFIEFEQEEISNNQINQNVNVVQNNQIKSFLDPLKFLELKKIDLIFNLTRKNNCTEEKAEKIFQIIIEIIKQLKQTRTSRSLSEDVISLKKEELSEIDGQLFEHWLLKTLEYDDSYVYAYNMLAQETNRQMRMNACPLKSVSDPYLFQLLENEKAQVDSINKPYLPNQSNTQEVKASNPNGLDLGSPKNSKSTINFLIGPDSVKSRLLEFLIDTYSGEKGKGIAIMILALEENKLIAYTENAELYSALRVDFGDIGTNSGINRYLTEVMCMDKEYRKDIASFRKDKKPYRKLAKIVVLVV